MKAESAVRCVALACVVLAAAACGSAAARGTRPSAPAVKAPSCMAKWAVSGDQAINPAPARAGLADILVPPTPLVMTICRYAGFNQPVSAGKLERSRVVTGKQLATFVTSLDSPARQVVTQPAIYNCPADQGSIDLLRFAYSSGPGVDLKVGLLGCWFVTNGLRTIGGYSIGLRVESWVGADKAP